MRVKRKPIGEVRFETLGPGAVFFWDDRYFLKIRVKTPDQAANAVALHGDLSIFNHDSLVRRVEGCFVEGEE